jgi:hypothetical protein
MYKEDRLSRFIVNQRGDVVHAEAASMTLSYAIPLIRSPDTV